MYPMHHLVVKFSMTLNPWMYPVLWKRIGFNGDPDPGVKPERNRADLDPGHAFPWILT